MTYRSPSIFDLTSGNTPKLGDVTAFNPTNPLSTANMGFNPIKANYSLGTGVNPLEGLKMGSGGILNLGNSNSGGFFGNGVDLGFNAPTANLAMNGLGGILQLLGANSARKAIESQQRVAEENLAMTKKAYDTNIDRKYLAASLQAGKSQDEARAYADSALSRYGTGSILSTSNLARNTQG